MCRLDQLRASSGRAALVELADAEHERAVGAVDVVAVDVEHVGDRVVGAHLLDLLEGLVHQLGVDQRHRRGVGEHGVLVVG